LPPPVNESNQKNPEVLSYQATISSTSVVPCPIWNRHSYPTFR
jgi:hypothetical protein